MVNKTESPDDLALLLIEVNSTSRQFADLVVRFNDVMRFVSENAELSTADFGPFAELAETLGDLDLALNNIEKVYRKKL